ncbi:hypothetical protein ETAA8_29500 [Anatilimnocola aggregata]|uniref:Uncharacterized protein n=1 Tax=Anatilimnocola aggregata TaxID=2528021 RepID=A0A517YCE9_9BACT|nr:hypothetical protein ETAA8_29500 [Anatilimnocola aggregata]
MATRRVSLALPVLFCDTKIDVQPKLNISPFCTGQRVVGEYILSFLTTHFANHLATMKTKLERQYDLSTDDRGSSNVDCCRTTSIGRRYLGFA